MPGWLQGLVSAGLAVALLWSALLLTLLLRRPDGVTLRATARLLPDLLRLLRSLARDGSLPRHVRVGIWLPLVYLAAPIDLVPDFIPVVGHVDDLIVVALLVRAVVRRAGPAAVQRHWTGTPEGLRALGWLVGRRPA